MSVDEGLERDISEKFKLILNSYEAIVSFPYWNCMRGLVPVLKILI